MAMTSIFATEKGVCFLCGAYGPTDVHHIFNGHGLRDKSEKYGLTVNLCRGCHEQIHADAYRRKKLKEYAQRRAMKEFNMSMEEWRELFYKNYTEEI